MPLKIIILGMMGRCPFGGQTWVYLNWLRAFSRLGHDVYYVEDDTVWPYDPVRDTVTDDCEYAVKHISTCLARIGLENQWAVRLFGKPGAVWNTTDTELNERYRDCDLLINLVGSTDLRDEHMKAPLRVYLQTDSVTSELRLANGDQHTREAFDNHHHIVTYGENYGAPDCGVPLNGVSYKKTRQPIDMDLWPMAYDPSARYFTTIGNYRQGGSDVEYNGQTYRWSKHYEWEKVIDLPRRTKQEFEIAVMPSDPADRTFLESHGWHLVPPLKMSLDIFGEYPAYFRKSRGAFTVAKDQNIRLRSGWFSDREVCYLACGKPTITQDTAFGNIIPTGRGLYSFQTIDDALAAIEKINADYEGECYAARELCSSYFSAPKIGAQFLKDVGL